MEVGNCEPFTQLVPLKEAAFKKAKDPSLVAMSPKKDTDIWFGYPYFMMPFFTCSLLSPQYNSFF